METVDFEIIKKELGVRFTKFLDKKQISPYKLALTIYKKSNNTPNNLKNGKHLPNFEFMYLLKHHYSDVDLNWLVFGEHTIESIVSEPAVEYEKEEGIMLSENQKLLKEKHLLLDENNKLKNKLLKSYETIIKHGLNPE